jgi:hydroxymethylbilane synthase
VDTRLRKASSEPYDAIVLAAAGLNRLNQSDRVTELLPPEVMLPAVGQGALAVEIRAGDEDVRFLVDPLNHLPTWSATRAERAFLARLGGGCHVPVAAYGVVQEGDLWLRALVGSPDGRIIVRGERRGAVAKAESLGQALAGELLGRGAAELLNKSEESLGN